MSNSKAKADMIRKQLTEVIRHSKMTQAEIARRLNVSPQMITDYKNARKFPQLDIFATLCEILNVSADEILAIKRRVE